MHDTGVQYCDIVIAIFLIDLKQSFPKSGLLQSPYKTKNTPKMKNWLYCKHWMVFVPQTNKVKCKKYKL